MSPGQGASGAPGRAPVDSRLVTTRSPARRIAGSSVLSLASAVLLTLSAVMPALAHAELVRSDPEDGAVLATSPASITLTFSEGLNRGKSSFKLVGPGGPGGTGRAATDGATTMTLTGLALGAGTWKIQWTAAAEDGHIERGALAFTVSEPTPAPATPTPTAASTTPAVDETADTATAGPTGATGPTTTAEPSASPAGDGSPGAASTGDVLLPIVAGLLVVGIVGALVLRRSRRV